MTKPATSTNTKPATKRQTTKVVGPKTTTTTSQQQESEDTAFAQKQKQMLTALRVPKHYMQNNNPTSNNVDLYQIMSIRKDQIYRMLDKFFHVLNHPVSHESFAMASSVFTELSKYLDLKERTVIGEAWRNLYTQETEEGYQNLKDTIGKVKIRFA